MAGGDAVVPLVDKKMMRKLGGMTNESAASEVSDFARRQMKMMGWSEGKGLGKNEQGITSHVKVKRREELQGVGVEKEAVKEQQNQWWYNVYDRMARKIVVDASSEEEGEAKETTTKKKPVKEKRKREEERGRKWQIPTDKELFAATGGKLFGRRAYGSCNGKLKRDELQLKKAKTHESEELAMTTSCNDTMRRREREERAKKKDRKLKKIKKETKKAVSVHLTG